MEKNQSNTNGKMLLLKSYFRKGEFGSCFSSLIACLLVGLSAISATVSANPIPDVWLETDYPLDLPKKLIGVNGLVAFYADSNDSADAASNYTWYCQKLVAGVYVNCDPGDVSVEDEKFNEDGNGSSKYVLMGLKPGIYAVGVHYDNAYGEDSNPAENSKNGGSPSFVKAWEFVVVGFELTLKDPSDNAPISPPNRMCFNAQPDYANVVYTVSINPATDPDGSNYLANLTASGKCTFIGGSTSKQVTNGTDVTLIAVEPSAADSTWFLDAVLAQDSNIAASVSEQVFKFDFVVETIPQTRDPIGIADPGTLIQITPGGPGGFWYTRQAGIVKIPDLNIGSFRVKTTIEHDAKHGMAATFTGATDAPSWMPSVSSSSSWTALVALVCVAAGDYTAITTTVGAVVTFIMNHADNSSLVHTAGGAGKVGFDIDGKAPSQTQANLGGLPPLKIAPVIGGAGSPPNCTLQDLEHVPLTPPTASWSIPSGGGGNGDLGSSQIAMEWCDFHTNYIDISIYLGYEVKSSAPLEWRVLSTGGNPNYPVQQGSLPHITTYAGGGFDITDASARIWDWNIDSNSIFQIQSNIVP